MTAENISSSSAINVSSTENLSSKLTTEGSNVSPAQDKDSEIIVAAPPAFEMPFNDDDETSAIFNMFRSHLFLSPPHLEIARPRRADVVEKAKDVTIETTQQVYNFSKNVAQGVADTLKSIVTREAEHPPEKCGIEHVQVLFMLHLPEDEIKRKYLHIEGKPHHELTSILEDSFSQWMKEIEEEKSKSKREAETQGTPKTDEISTASTEATTLQESLESRFKRHEAESHPLLNKRESFENVTELAANISEVQASIIHDDTPAVWQIRDTSDKHKKSADYKPEETHFLFYSGGTVESATAKSSEHISSHRPGVTGSKRVKRQVEVKEEVILQKTVKKMVPNYGDRKLIRRRGLRDSNIVDDYNAGGGLKTRPYFLIVALPTVLCKTIILYR